MEVILWTISFSVCPLCGDVVLTQQPQQPPQQILGFLAQVSSSQSAIQRVWRPNGSAATMPTKESATARMERLNFILVSMSVGCLVPCDTILMVRA